MILIAKYLQIIQTLIAFFGVDLLQMISILLSNWNNCNVFWNNLGEVRFSFKLMNYESSGKNILKGVLTKGVTDQEEEQDRVSVEQLNNRA